jgi:hypothetical protein
VDEPRYSTPELLSLERDLVGQAERRAGAQTAIVASDHVRAALQARPGLDADQAAMVRQVTEDGAGVSLVVGYAGSGKAYATGAAVDAFRRHGLQCSARHPPERPPANSNARPTLPHPRSTACWANSVTVANGSIVTPSW